MSDVERVGAAMREADAKLQVRPPDVSETVGHARRSLIRRLLIVGALGALGAVLLIVGGSAPAFKQLSNTHNTSKGQKTGKNGNGGGKNGHGGGGKGGGNGGGGKGGGGGGHPKHHERFVAAVGPGVPIEVPLPDLVVSHLTKTEVTVANQSEASAEPFVVEVTVEAEGQKPLTVTIPFEKGLEAESEEAEPFTLECESGTIIADVDPENEIEESSEEDNVSTESPPVECEPTKDEEEGKAGKGRAKETSGSGSGSGSGSSTGTVDAATGASGGATAP